MSKMIIKQKRSASLITCSALCARLSVPLVLLLAGCGDYQKFASPSGSISASSTAVGPTAASTVPTANAAIGRIQNGLEMNAVSTSGNFATFVGSVRANLPKVTDPTKATGYDQVQLLAFGACSDLIQGTTPLMKSKYGVDPKATIASNQTALVAAGMHILDQYSARLASQGSQASQLNSIFAGLVSQSQSNLASVTTTPVLKGSVVATASQSMMAFLTVCTAANSTGATMLGM